MPTKLIDRLLFAQGGCCFFCQSLLTPGKASVEHLIASSHGGSNDPNNCVVCCQALNALLGSMSLKEKLLVLLNQKGQFKCPAGNVPEAKPGVPKVAKLTVPERRAPKLVVSKRVGPIPVASQCTAPKPSVPKTTVKPTLDQRLVLIVANLRKRGGKGLPTRVKSLTSAISELFQKKISQKDVATLLKELQAYGIICVDNTKVTYALRRKLPDT